MSIDHKNQVLSPIVIEWTHHRQMCSSLFIQFLFKNKRFCEKPRGAMQQRCRCCLCLLSPTSVCKSEWPSSEASTTPVPRQPLLCQVVWTAYWLKRIIKSWHAVTSPQPCEMTTTDVSGENKQACLVMWREELKTLSSMKKTEDSTPSIYIELGFLLIEWVFFFYPQYFF